MLEHSNHPTWGEGPPCLKSNPHTGEASSADAPSRSNTAENAVIGSRGSRFFAAYNGECKLGRKSSRCIESGQRHVNAPSRASKEFQKARPRPNRSSSTGSSERVGRTQGKDAPRSSQATLQSNTGKRGLDSVPRYSPSSRPKRLVSCRIFLKKSVSVYKKRVG